MERQPKMYNTGADYALAIIGGKWKSVILYLLAGHPSNLNNEGQHKDFHPQELSDIQHVEESY